MLTECSVAHILVFWGQHSKERVKNLCSSKTLLSFYFGLTLEITFLCALLVCHTKISL